MTQTGFVAGGRLTDAISLGVLASWVPRDAVDDAIEAAGKGARRSGGKLPPHVMVYFAMALALFDDDFEEVIVKLTETLQSWGCWDKGWEVPTSGGITQARQRLGHEPVKELFAQVAAPVAGEDTAGAFLGPWRLTSIDGFEWDAPATPENIAAFGFAGTGKDAAPAAFPKVRVVTVAECASHAVVAAALGPVASKGSGEQSLARTVYPRLEEDWLLICSPRSSSARSFPAQTSAAPGLPARISMARTSPAPTSPTPISPTPDVQAAITVVGRKLSVPLEQQRLGSLPAPRKDSPDDVIDAATGPA